MKLLQMQFISAPIISYFLGPNSFLIILISNTHSQCSSLSVRVQLSQPKENKRLITIAEHFDPRVFK
jgi:hypothetical protein